MHRLHNRESCCYQELLLSSLFDATSYGVKAAADFSRPKAAPALGDGDGASGDVLMFQLELERLLQSAAHAPPPTPFDQPRWATYRAYERRTADLRLASASDRTTTRHRIGANHDVPTGQKRFPEHNGLPRRGLPG
jgi:hypothetical protein